MKLRFLGNNSTGGDCPTLYATDRDSYVVQGWQIFANDLLMQLHITDGESAVEVPTELFEHLEKDGLPATSITRVQAPIMILTPQGTCVVQGKVVTDTEALTQMSIPYYETCVEVSKSDVTALAEEPSGTDFQR
ncbi:hypothetical protein ACFRIC_39030 [Streptomyces sp. NPDC056738]|uniref:hypothetical protein n=1 Tax=Streptomyces sp. NPDC056738 TaxID=3345933 RepID=UPI003699CB8B